MSETTYDLMITPRACQGFQWIGQSFEHCDRCGEPFWNHSHEDRLADPGRGGGPFGARSRLVVISRDKAARVRAKWDSSLRTYR